jgi:hypothetical protein
VRAGTENGKTNPVKPAIPVWMWAAIAAAVLFTLYNFWNTEKERAIISDLRKQVAEQVQEQQSQQRQLAMTHREALILTSPQSAKFTMAPSKKDLPVLQATWNSAFGIAVTGQKVRAPSGNHTLQLWLIPKAARGKPIPSLTLRPDPDGKLDLLVAQPPDTIEATKALVITEEAEGGSAQPTTTPLWVGSVPVSGG